MSVAIIKRAEQINYWLVDMVNALGCNDIEKAKMMQRKITQELEDFGASIQSISPYELNKTRVEWVDESRVSVIEWFSYAKNTLLMVRSRLR